MAIRWMMTSLTSDPNYMPVPDLHNEDTPDTTKGQPPTSKRRCRRPVLEEVPEEDVEEDMGTATPQEKRSTTNRGKTAGNLRQYIQNKPDKWEFKLFSRALADGFVHNMVLYQGLTMLQGHGVKLTPEQEALSTTSKIVSVLAQTMKCSQSAIFANNFFTSLQIARYLKNTHGCRYTGTARENRIRNPPHKVYKEL
ncbi:hypothetical protein HAZT_HAZT003510 [Hyalella azteca]|uniref:PiggyBac transposable element-derived protein domain-containing protein n=1 Tax=Hyalella azteca TaxID=294128 RepID=A0A6A0H0V6_HYAAZ|nr:hypothetical protein HAZT_HAZT003510 [Hyalella azteca]